MLGLLVVFLSECEEMWIDLLVGVKYVCVDWMCMLWWCGWFIEVLVCVESGLWFGLWWLWVWMVLSCELRVYLNLFMEWK